jgi:hypothetical protein
VIVYAKSSSIARKDVNYVKEDYAPFSDEKFRKIANSKIGDIKSDYALCIKQ